MMPAVWLDSRPRGGIEAKKLSSDQQIAWSSLPFAINLTRGNESDKTTPRLQKAIPGFKFAAVDLSLVFVHDDLAIRPAQGERRAQREDDYGSVQLGLDAHARRRAGQSKGQGTVEDHWVRLKQNVTDNLLKDFRLQQESGCIGPVQSGYPESLAVT
jgi:hypothetical protein